MGGDSGAGMVFGLEGYGFVAVGQEQPEELVCDYFGGEHARFAGDFLSFPLGQGKKFFQENPAGLKPDRNKNPRSYTGVFIAFVKPTKLPVLPIVADRRWQRRFQA